MTTVSNLGKPKALLCKRYSQDSPYCCEQHACALCNFDAFTCSLRALIFKLTNVTVSQLNTKQML